MNPLIGFTMGAIMAVIPMIIGYLYCKHSIKLKTILKRDNVYSATIVHSKTATGSSTSYYESELARDDRQSKEYAEHIFLTPNEKQAITKLIKHI
jgi:hypothetical protein